MNGRVLVIGAGGVATVAIVKMAMNSDIFKEIKIASRTKAKCDNIVKYINEKLPNCKAALSTAQVDADDVSWIGVILTIKSSLSKSSDRRTGSRIVSLVTGKLRVYFRPTGFGKLFVISEISSNVRD